MARSLRNSQKDHFILYKPKDIVSGDVYWCRKIDGRLYLAAIDCTGHGVPGALISIIANYTINRAINEFGLIHPGDILGTVSEIMQQELNRHKDTTVHDGMDIALICIDFENKQIEYAGAHNPLIIVRRNKIININADKKPIGYFVFNRSNDFENHTFKFHKNDKFYIFSDGFADQFGGPKDKKYSYKRLMEIILANSKLNFDEQKEELEKSYLDWKGDEDQIDDILVLGFTI